MHLVGAFVHLTIFTIVLDKPISSSSQTVGSIKSHVASNNPGTKEETIVRPDMLSKYTSNVVWDRIFELIIFVCITLLFVYLVFRLLEMWYGRTNALTYGMSYKDQCHSRASSR